MIRIGQENKVQSKQQLQSQKEPITTYMKECQTLPVFGKIVRLLRFMLMKQRERSILYRASVCLKENIDGLETLLNASKIDALQFREQILHPLEKLVQKAILSWDEAYNKISYFETLHLKGTLINYDIRFLNKDMPFTYLQETFEQILSVQFYDGRYRSFEGKMNMSSPQFFEKSSVYIDTSLSPNRFERKLEEGTENDLEANIVADLVEYAIRQMEFDDSLTLDDIGIISAYKSQVALIKQKITAKFPHLKSKVHDLVATLDSYQGQECKIIIYSFTRSNSNPKHFPRIGFLKELRRLNVALSRGQKQLILIGDDSCLRSCELPDEGHFRNLFI